LLKGSTTVIAPPGAAKVSGGSGDEPVLVNPTGTPWLATAGSGDVLSGLAGALLAQGLPPAQAGLAAAYLHGMAGRLAAAGAYSTAATAGTDARRAMDGRRAADDAPTPESTGGTGEAPIGASDLVRALPAAFRSL
jgi:NAD(P)H-hydrate repair Nnr-like enzyme with NAD(P)H-hydrate dehydratase domain